MTGDTVSALRWLLGEDHGCEGRILSAAYKYQDTMVNRSPCVTESTSCVVSAGKQTNVPGGGVSATRLGGPE